jgi:hypothetical protein
MDFSVMVVIQIFIFMLYNIVGEDLHPVGHQHLERGNLSIPTHHDTHF